ncbi:MAG: hypothetical protein H7Y06_04740 [Opitutaceae bacterium]|nr:hypothetical protein [Opitutaceae bacterium]
MLVGRGPALAAAERADFRACTDTERLLICGELIRGNRRDADFSTTVIHAIALISRLGGADHADSDVCLGADILPDDSAQPVVTSID